VGWKLRLCLLMNPIALVEREPMWDGNSYSTSIVLPTVSGLSENQCGMETGRRDRTSSPRRKLSENQCGMETQLRLSRLPDQGQVEREPMWDGNNFKPKFHTKTPPC